MTIMPIPSSIAGYFTALGEQIEAHYRRCNYNDADLPTIATDALEQFKEGFAFDALPIADFFSTTSIPQQPGTRFSDLPITVFRHREFYIEILIWTRSTTSVHQHGFSGAFKVLQGSSIHTTFGFKSQHDISPDCILGAITPQHTEYLQKDSIQQIKPGREGLIHSLYHLDNPSLTLVVRNDGHKLYQPQYTFYRPCFAFNEFQLEKDELVVLYARLLYVAKQINRQSMLQVWLDHISKLDFPRLAYLFLLKNSYLQNLAEQEDFLSKAKQTHGELIDYLKQAAQFKQTLEHISRSRTVFSDPDLRYFLALLMNAKDKASLLEMVKVRYPEQDPSECCARWMTRLSAGKADTARRLAQVVQQANVGGLHLGQKLGVTLPSNLTDEQANSLFASFIRSGSTPKELTAHLPHINPADLQEFFRRLASLEELRCLR